MANLSKAIGHLSQAMNMMIDQQAQRGLQAMQHEERIRASEEQLRAIHADLREKTVRIRELIAFADQVQGIV